jgi:hypothetical protein
MNESNRTRRCIVFADGIECVDSGSPSEVARAVAQLLQQRPDARILAFDESSSEPVELDALMRAMPAAEPASAGTPGQAEAAPRARGRPRLGVVSREVTLLPRHWEWLNAQPGGASVALRRLVDEARIAGAGRERQRLAQESAYRFMSAIAGDRPNFEEASRALFAGDLDRLAELVGAWPGDVKNHLLRLADAASGSIPMS